MAKILFTWECGAGIGHLSTYVKLIDLLIQDKHEILFLVQNVASAQKVFEAKDVQIGQAPIRKENLEGGVAPPKSYSHVLRNQGFASKDGLLGRVKSWRFIYETWKPNVIIFDHSPTAVLASHFYKKAKLVMSGNGFSLPPDHSPMKPFETSDKMVTVDLLKEEQYLLEDHINPCMRHFGGPVFEHLNEIFKPDDRWLHCFQELDHYQDRENDVHLGVDIEIRGIKPVWPARSGPRIFAYLKPNKLVEPLLLALKELAYPTLIYGDQLPPFFESHFSSPTIKFSHKLLDISVVAEDAQLAITNANSGTTTHFLLKGVPVLMVPLHIEQYLSAVSIKRMNCGEYITEKSDKNVIQYFIKELVQKDSLYRQKACEFATKYKSVETDNVTEIMYRRVEELLNNNLNPKLHF